VRRQEGDNDVLVSVSSARWGEFRGILRATHFEQIGWCLAPARTVIQRSFDHLGFYRRVLAGLDALVP
jgi:triacylglycerol lipase